RPGAGGAGGERCHGYAPPARRRRSKRDRPADSAIRKSRPQSYMRRPMRRMVGHSAKFALVIPCCLGKASPTSLFPKDATTTKAGASAAGGVAHPLHEFGS